MTTPIHDALLATHLRDTGMTAVVNHADPRLIAAVDAAIESLIDAGEPFSADDVRDLIPVSALPLVGSRMNSYRMRRNPQRMVVVGQVVSDWPATHRKPILRYIGAQHVADGAA